MSPAPRTPTFSIFAIPPPLSLAGAGAYPYAARSHTADSVSISSRSARADGSDPAAWARTDARRTAPRARHSARVGDASATNLRRAGRPGRANGRLRGSPFGDVHSSRLTTALGRRRELC